MKANVLAIKGILEVRPDVIFIQSELSEYFHADSPKAIKPARSINARRFLSLDLKYGRRIESEMYEYLLVAIIKSFDLSTMLLHFMLSYLLFAGALHID